jgi:DNA-directed RNA polymerase specialized sigma24 family protein
MMGGSEGEPNRFPTTQWSAVEQAGAAGEGSGVALEQLLPRYLAPLRAHLVHHKRLSPQQADDLLQAFLAEKVLERNLIGGAVREKGRFRTFLLMALDRFVSNQLRDARRLKRSPREELVPLEHAAAAPVRGPTPSGVFEAAWARQVLSNAAERMRAECEASNRQDIWQIFEGRVLAPTLDGAEPVPYEQFVTRFGLSDVDAASNLLVTAKRMFARSLRGVVGEYMGEDGQIDQEIAELREVLGRGRE